MGKRSAFDKIQKDQYLTPEKALLPLVPFLPDTAFQFAEPCAGDGRLATYIEKHTKGRSSLLCDIDPEGAAETANIHFNGTFNRNVTKKDALKLQKIDFSHTDFIITNPPWSRDKKSGYILHELITHFSQFLPTWLLFDADWAHTKQAIPYLKKCTHIVSVGRVKWMPNTNQTGKDNAAWYCFHPKGNEITGGTRFFGVPG